MMMSFTEKILSNVPWFAMATDVKSVDADQLSAHSFTNDIIRKAEPCVIRGAVKHWPAVEKWVDTSYLRQIAGHESVNIFPHSNLLGPRQGEGRSSLRFGDAIKKLEDAIEDEELSLPAVDISPQSFSVLLADIGDISFLSDFAPPLLYPQSRFFMYRNAGTAWHSHPNDETLLCQLVGSKRIGLICANSSNNSKIRDFFLDQKYFEINGEDVSQVEVECFVAEIRPGDALYIPPFWWHGVSPIEKGFGVSVARCWRSPADRLFRMAFWFMQENWREVIKNPFSFSVLPRMILLGFMNIFTISSQNQKVK